MKVSGKSKAALIAVGATSLIFALPALGQQGPESLLPPGFDNPPPPAPPASRPPASPPASNSPAPLQGTTSPAPATTGGLTPIAADEEKKGEEDALDEEPKIRFDVPPAARRSLSQVGIIAEASGGYPAAAFGGTDGNFLKRALRLTTGPLASRWGTIMARRMLVSRTDTPVNVNGADWVAERAWLLLRMGDSVTARQLVQQVDAGRYTPRLLQVAMQSFLANGDLSGMCPLSDSGALLVKDMSWKMSRPICASLAGEQGTATSLLNQARSQGWAKGIDYLLAEKAVGAGIEGRRSVKIEWEKVQTPSAWRLGLAAATGMEPPERLYQQTGRHVSGWRAQLPMLPVESRVKVSSEAAHLGVLSNRALVDLYAQAYDDSDSSDATKARADLLKTAYAGSSTSDRVSAMKSLWANAKPGADRHAMLILTARAAAVLQPTDDAKSVSDDLIASMFTAGFDRSAAGWLNVVDEGSLGWALIAVGAPDNRRVSSGALDDFSGNDNSEAYHKSALLLAGLAGLGRVDSSTQSSFASDISADISRQSTWSRAITAAAERGEPGTVALLAASGLQASDWTKIPARHLYYIVRSLRQVGLDAEARMIAAEAVTFG